MSSLSLPLSFLPPFLPLHACLCACVCVSVCVCVCACVCLHVCITSHHKLTISPCRSPLLPTFPTHTTPTSLTGHPHPLGCTLELCGICLRMSFELHIDGCVIDSVLCLIEIPGVSPLLSFCDQPDLRPKLLTSARETSRMDRLCKVLKLYFLNLFFIEV